MSDPSPAIRHLLDEAGVAREHFLAELAGISADEGARKPAADVWSLQEVVEHLVLAERLGFGLIWTAAERYRAGDPVWSGQSENAELPIETIIERTWRPKEQAPPEAAPSGGGSLGIWCAHLATCDDLLTRLVPLLDGLPLRDVIYPHFLCGPLDAIQRLEFIRFHIAWHQRQVGSIKSLLHIE